MNIVEKRIDEVIPYENNPRNNESAIDAVANSIREFGFKVPLVIDKDDIIVCGHTRLKAAMQLGLETVPCIVADDLTEEQLKAFRVADNKTAELAGWDFMKLSVELQELKELDFNMEDFGFTEETDLDLDGFFEDAEPKEKEPEQIQCPHCGEWFEV